MQLSPGDTIRSGDVIRRIVDVRPTGYGWEYPDMDAGEENYFWSENSSDPFFDLNWHLVEGTKTFIHVTPTCEHVWDGPAVEPDGPGSYAVTCSRCGLDAMTHSLRTGI